MGRTSSFQHPTDSNMHNATPTAFIALLQMLHLTSALPTSRSMLLEEKKGGTEPYYKLGTWDSCPSGYAPVQTQSECESAYAPLKGITIHNLVYASPFPYGPDWTSPIGCFVGTDPSNGVSNLFFNIASNRGQRITNTGPNQLVCSLDCSDVKSVEGKWNRLQSSNGDSQQVTITVGTTTTNSNTDSTSYGNNLESSVKAGFSFGGAQASVEVKGSVSQSMSHAYSDTFSQTTTKEQTFTFTAGTVWQWEFDATGQWSCGDGTSKSSSLMLTPNHNAPCCLPGYFLNDQDPTGGCMEGSPRQC